MSEKYISVTQLNQYIKSIMDNDSYLKNVVLKGQVSNFTNHAKTGHFYFTLKDSQSSIRVVMFNQYASKIKFDVQNGQDIVITGSVQVFPRDGGYQVYCTSIEPFGMGALHLAFEQLKEKLYKEGLFAPEHKKPLPKTPRNIGVITSGTSAAFADIKNVMSRRYPIAKIFLIDSLVQGDNAAQALRKGVIQCSTCDLDVIIIARGGGSIEDLWCFNDEELAREIYRCPIPIVTGVGHEIDYTIVDFVADVRAATPSAAVEICTPDFAEIKHRLGVSMVRLNTQIKSLVTTYAKQVKEYKTALNSCVGNRVVNDQKLLESYKSRIQKTLSVEAVEQKEQVLMNAYTQLSKAMDRQIVARENAVAHKLSTVENISPLKVLSRGYSITKVGDKVLTESSQVQSGQEITTKLRHGQIKSVVV